MKLLCVILCLAIITVLFSCAEKEKIHMNVDIRKDESNRIYKLVINQFDTFKVTDMKVDQELYKYNIDKSEIEYLGRSLPKRYMNTYLEAIQDYETGNNYKMSDLIIPQLLKITPNGFCYQFSNIGFSKNMDFAILYTYISNSDICNEDCLYVLKKEGNDWKIITEMIS